MPAPPSSEYRALESLHKNGSASQKHLQESCDCISGPRHHNLYGVTMMFRAAEWLVAEVAVTVMVAGPGGVPLG